MNNKSNRQRLVNAAAKIAANRDQVPVSKTMAARKLFVSEKRDWSKPEAPRIGWKRGELVEVALALFGQGDLSEEWGDVAYYAAQSWDWLWYAYSIVTPKQIIAHAADKMERRANK